MVEGKYGSLQTSRIIEFREELPKSGAGKILKRILAEEEKGTATGIEQKP